MCGKGHITKMYRDPVEITRPLVYVIVCSPFDFLYACVQVELTVCCGGVP